MSVPPAYAAHVRDQLLAALRDRDDQAAEQVLLRMAELYPEETAELTRQLVDVGWDRVLERLTHPDARDDDAL